MDPEESRLPDERTNEPIDNGRCLYSAGRGADPDLRVFANRTEGRSGAADEAWLQRVLSSQLGGEVLRGVLAPASIDHGDKETWHFLGREKHVPVINSYIDLLYVTNSGRPILVETKLARNPEKRREVIAQVAEYSLGLRSLTADDLVDEREADEELAELKPLMQQHLSTGRLDLVVVGDEVDERALALGHYLLDDPTNQMSIWFIEIGLYEFTDAPNRRIIVPTLRHAALSEVRHTIEVEVTLKPDTQADVSYHATPASKTSASPTTTSGRSPKLTKGELLNEIEAAAGEKARDAAERLIRFAEKRDLHVGMRPTGASIRLPVPGDHSTRVTLFVVTKYATFYMAWLNWEERGGLPQEFADRYLDRITEMLGQSPADVNHPAQAAKAYPLSELSKHVEQLIDIVDETVSQVRRWGDEQPGVERQS